MNRRNARTRGFTLTEVAIVLGIVGLILGAIWVAAAAVYNNQRVATTSTQLVQMVGNIRALFATSTTMTGNQLTLADAGAIPKDLVTTNAAGAATAVTNVWGGAVTVAPVGIGTSFIITYPLVPREACNSLAMRIGGSGHDAGLTAIGAQALTAGTAITLAQAAAVCANLVNTLTFTFLLRT